MEQLRKNLHLPEWEYVIFGLVTVIFLILIIVGLTSPIKIRPIPNDDDYTTKTITIGPESSVTVKLYVPQGFCLEDSTYVIPVDDIVGTGQLSSKIGIVKNDDDVSASSVLFTNGQNAYSSSFYVPCNHSDMKGTCSPAKDKWVYLTLTSTYTTKIKVVVKNELISINNYADW